MTSLQEICDHSNEKLIVKNSVQFWDGNTRYTCKICGLEIIKKEQELFTEPCDHDKMKYLKRDNIQYDNGTVRYKCQKCNTIITNKLKRIDDDIDENIVSKEPIKDSCDHLKTTYLKLEGPQSNDGKHRYRCLKCNEKVIIDFFNKVKA